MLQSLGCNVPCGKSVPIRVFRDDLNVILNSQNLAADLSKKIIAISFHVVREAVAAIILEPYWLRDKYNPSDNMTKRIPRT